MLLVLLGEDANTWKEALQALLHHTMRTAIRIRKWIINALGRFAFTALLELPRMRHIQHLEPTTLGRLYARDKHFAQIHFVVAAQHAIDGGTLILVVVEEVDEHNGQQDGRYGSWNSIYTYRASIHLI